MKISCPHCQQKLDAPPEMAEQITICPACNNKFFIAIQEVVKVEKNDTNIVNKECPKCGVNIKLNSLKCSFCGLIFDERQKLLKQHSNGEKKFYFLTFCIIICLISIIIWQYNITVELRKQINELRDNNNNLAGNNISLKNQIDDIKYGAEKLNNEAQSLFQEGKLPDALQKINTLFEKHPDKKVSTLYKSFYNKIQEAILNKEIQLSKEKKELEARLNKNISSKYDKMQYTTWYETTRDIRYSSNDSEWYYVELYIGKLDNGKKYFRLRTQYSNLQNKDTKWIFYNQIQLLGDNGKNIYITTDHPEKKSEVCSWGLKEWSDNLVMEDDFIELAKAKTIRVKFCGKYSSEFDLNENQTMAVKEIIEKYKSL